MAKPTPGPWDLRDDDKRISVGIGLVEGPNGYDVAEVYNDDCDREEAWANARLISAAPELLEALIAATDVLKTASKMLTEENKIVLKGRQWAGNTIADAEHAIAKATGAA